MSRAAITLLHLNGWVAVLIGSFIVLDPVSMLSSYGLQPAPSTGLLSELRAPGGFLIASGLFIVRCALQRQRYRQGFELSALLYGGYGFSRLIAWVADGQPPEAIVIAAAIELTLFAASLFMLMKGKEKNLYPAADLV